MEARKPRINSPLILFVLLIQVLAGCAQFDPAQESVRLIGRFEPTATNALHFTWPGSAIEFRFSGTQAAIALASTQRTRFMVEVDNNTNELWVEGPAKTYTLAQNLAHGTHTVRVTRIAESFEGVTSIIPSPIVDGKLLAAPVSPGKNILAIGDSITAGYGTEGASKTCGYSMATSNQLTTYAAVAARALNADLHAIAWSGIGAWRSYGEETPVNPTILDRYTRTLADDANSKWNPVHFPADVITIAIGTNDYWTGSVTDAYRKGLAKLIKKVQSDLPDTPIYLIVSPMLNGEARESQMSEMNALQLSNVKVIDLGKIEASDGYGCDYHPNSKTHKRMGEALVGVLRTDLNW